MIENTFSDDEAAITSVDLDHLESAIGKKPTFRERLGRQLLLPES